MKNQNTELGAQSTRAGLKRLQDVNLSDDFLFTKVMENPETCRKMLELLLGISIEQIVWLESQKTLKHESDGKGIRMDAYAKDNNEHAYDVEIQCKVERKDIPKRARAYGSSVDMDMIQQGGYYRDMKASFIIFICTFDLFRQGRHVYTFRNRCLEDSEVDLGDDTTKIFFNTKGTADDVSEGVLEFLHYIEDTTDEFAKQAKTAFIKELHHRVKRVKNDRRTEEAYMTLQERDWENREEGRVEGREEERQSSIQNLVVACRSVGAAKDHIVQQVVDLYHLTIDEATNKVNMILSGV